MAPSVCFIWSSRFIATSGPMYPTYGHVDPPGGSHTVLTELWDAAEPA